MSITENRLIETIGYHIKNKMMMCVERDFEDGTDKMMGFPMIISDELLLTTVVNDFHDEGFAILRLSDITDVYSKENDVFYEKICIHENMGIKKSDIVQDVSNWKVVLKQLENYNGLISMQCEKQIERCTFYLGSIVSVSDDKVIFQDVGIDGEWDKEDNIIPYEEITQIAFGDNYSKTFYKYVNEQID